MKLRTARDQHWPPSLMFGVYTNRNPGVLIDVDLVLAQALREYEDGLCSGCGQPAHISYNLANIGEIQVDAKTTCLGCKARDDFREKTKKPPAGQIVRLINKHFEPKMRRNRGS